MRCGFVVVLGAFGTLAALAGPAAGDEAVRLDPESGSFDRTLPSSKAFALEVPVPGKEMVRGELEIWPALDAACQRAGDGRQHHRLALLASGSDSERVLRTQVPALQVNTRFCFTVRITRGLDESRGVGFAALVTDQAMGAVDVEQLCSAPNRDAMLAHAVGVAIAAFSEVELRQLAVGRRSGVDAKVDVDRDPAVADAIGRAVVTGVDLVARCAEIKRARAAAELAGNLAVQAGRDRERAFAALLPYDGAASLLAVHLARARLPVLVTSAPPSYRVVALADAADDDALVVPAAQVLARVAPALADPLRAIAAARAEDKPRLRQAFRALVAELPPVPVALAYEPELALTSLDELFRVAPRAGEPPDRLRADITQRRSIVIANAALLEQQLKVYAQEDRVHAAPWVRALVALRDADQAYRASDVALRGELDAQDAAREALAARLRERMVVADVRALVQRVSSIRCSQRILGPQTEEGASSVSADVGVLLALPFRVDTARNGWEPWIVPYAGINIYVEGVDRVVPFSQLVGSWSRQRLSFTAGALLTRPEIAGAKISMPFRDSGVIPIAALGVRLTSFTRASLGGFAFDYQDANAASTKKHRAGAIWIGVSFDADLWAAVQGKAFQ